MSKGQQSLAFEHFRHPQIEGRDLHGLGSVSDDQGRSLLGQGDRRTVSIGRDLDVRQDR